MQDTIDVEVAPKIQVTPLSPACGAEISGVDLSKPLSAHDFGEHVASILTEPQYEEAPAFGIKADHGIVALGA